MWLDDNGVDVVGWSGAVNNLGSRVLDDLKTVEKFSGEARDNRVTVDEPASDEYMDLSLGAGLRQGWVKSWNVGKVDECSLVDFRAFSLPDNIKYTTP